jgi:hypothetical protein
VALVIPAAFFYFLTVRQHHLLKTQNVGTVFRAETADGEGVAGLDDVFRPAGPDQMVGAGGFGLPVFDGTLIGFED